MPPPHQGHGSRTIEQQRHALALPRRRVDVGEAELPLKPVALGNPHVTVDIGPNGAVPVHTGPGYRYLLRMIGGDHVTAEEGEFGTGIGILPLRPVEEAWRPRDQATGFLQACGLQAAVMANL